MCHRTRYDAALLLFYISGAPIRVQISDCEVFGRAVIQCQNEMDEEDNAHPGHDMHCIWGNHNALHGILHGITRFPYGVFVCFRSKLILKRDVYLFFYVLI